MGHTLLWHTIVHLLSLEYQSMNSISEHPERSQNLFLTLFPPVMTFVICSKPIFEFGREFDKSNPYMKFGKLLHTPSSGN